MRLKDVLHRLFGGGLRARIRARARRYARMGASFISVLALALVLGLALAAGGSRVGVDLDPPTLAAPSSPEHPNALRALVYLYGLRGAAARDSGQSRLFAPQAHRLREGWLIDGAEGAAQAYLNELRVKRGARHEVLAEARLIAAQERVVGGRRILHALDRLEGVIASGAVRPDRSGAAARAAGGIAAERCAVFARMLAEQAAQGRPGPPNARAEAAFHSARGEAYAWLLLLKAAAADTEDPALAASPALHEALAALARAADYQPLFLSNGPPGAAFQPNHLAVLGLDLALASEALGRFAEGG